MKISATGFNYTNVQPKQNTNKMQSFNGLWGRNSRNIDIDAVLSIPTHYETCYYYPFKDESAEQIKEVVKQNSSAEMITEEGQSKYIVKSCKVCTTLPFSKAQFDEYSSTQDLKSASDISVGIHKFLVKLSHRFIDNNQEHQTPAINHSFDKLYQNGRYINISG